jgi:hypothetical protein
VKLLSRSAGVVGGARVATRNRREETLTAQGSNGGIYRLHENGFTMKLGIVSEELQTHLGGGGGGGGTSSQVFASRRIHPNSMTSAESFVT